MLKKITILFLTLIVLQTALLSTETATTFAEVDTHLKKGGVIYAIVDVEDDLHQLSLKLEEMLQAVASINPQMGMAAAIPVSTLLNETGLPSIRALGISSTRRDQGFRNHTILLTDQGLKGLLGIYGTENQSFSIPQTAPAGTDLAIEMRVDTALITDVVRQIATGIMGPTGAQMIDLQLARPIGDSAFTYAEILEALRGKMVLILEVDPSETMQIPQLGDFPKVNFLLQFASAGTLTPEIAELLALADLSDFTSETDGDVTTMSGFLPAGFGLDVILQGNPVTGELALMSSAAFRAACQAESGPKLADAPAFIQATEGLSDKGLSLTFMSPEVNEVLLAFFQASMKAEGADAETMGPYIDWLTEGLLADFPVASVLSVVEGGLFAQSNWNASHKRNLATLTYANPVTIGLMAAMAIPAFQKVRATSQQKAITNNLRMLASAAQQAMLEEGIRSVRTANLIGPDAYIYAFEPIMGESYPEVITVEMTEIEAVLPNGETVRYQF